MTRRPDVYRTSFPVRSQSRNRANGGTEIYCCIDEETHASTEIESIELCSVSFDNTDDYRRVFISATVDAVNPMGSTASAWVLVGGSQTIIPAVQVDHLTPVAITGAIDLPAGSYDFVLYVATNNYGDPNVSCGQSSLQIIIGQVVDEQTCWHIGGGG